ncbi:MAG: nucleotide sugar dehydrogenase, partial [Thermodesulfobacteriota bacterium]
MDLLAKIDSRSARIGVLGLGYVGLPLVIEFCRAGFSVTGFDLDAEKVSMLRQGKSYIRHIDSAMLAAISCPPFSPTTDFSLLQEMDCIIICVPTPLNKNREPDMRYVFNTAQTIGKYLRKGQLVVLESTTYPGTTDQDVRAILEKDGLIAGRDFHLAFSPEREDPNNKDFGLRTIPKVVGGYTPECLEAAMAMYGAIVDRTIPVSSPRVAEAAKLLENIYRSVNIALVNELKMLFDRMEIDVWEVIEAAKTKPFGFQAFYPGPGLGGHCIPIDPFYLTWKAREFEFNTRFIELAGEINTAMPDYVVMKVMKALNAVGKHLRG